MPTARLSCDYYDAVTDNFSTLCAVSEASTPAPTPVFNQPPPVYIPMLRVPHQQPSLPPTDIRPFVRVTPFSNISIHDASTTASVQRSANSSLSVGVSHVYDTIYYTQPSVGMRYKPGDCVYYRNFFIGHYVGVESADINMAIVRLRTIVEDEPGHYMCRHISVQMSTCQVYHWCTLLRKCPKTRRASRREIANMGNEFSWVKKVFWFVTSWW